ncbi:MAG: RIP metalloprotease RseP [Anaerolineales bacterium]|nr:RIP metalloprotease RseP [Anaerolineales bacterium]
MTIIAFLLVFSLLVFVHELGHFTVAKLTGIRVEEFGLGYPPRLLTIARRGDTEYTINAIPFGGFVRMLGEEDPSHPGSFAAKSKLVRATDLLAGPLMNVVLAFLLLIGVGLLGFDIPIGSVAIIGVAPGSPAAEAGLQEGDTILSIDGLTVRNTYELSRYTRERLGEEVTLSVKRGEETMPVRLTPRREPPANEGAMGVMIQTVDIVGADKLRYSLWEAIPMAGRMVGDVIATIFFGVAGMIQGVIAPDITGPIGIAAVTSEIAKSGLVVLMRFTAFLSIQLAIFNLLPFPGLDGGRLAFIALEALRGGKRVTPEKEGLIHLVGLAILIGLMLIVSYQDIARLLSGQPILPP